MSLSRLKHWTVLISTFLAGQGSVQLVNLISGFLLLRWMSVEAYAQYSVAFGFQNTLGMLVDVGFSGSIVALVGDRISDKEVVGAYIRSAKHFRNQLFAIIIPIAALAFPLVTAKQNWDWMTQLLLFSSVVGSLFFQGWVGYYSAPLLMHQQMKAIYSPQIISSFCRLIVCYILYLASALSSWTNAWVSSAVVAVNGCIYRQRAKPFFAEPVKSNGQIQREMLKYISPLIPGVVFTAFQGQISLLLITWFGQSQSIAEVAALGRLGQLFTILGSFNSMIIAPYIAKVAPQQLARRYFQILSLALAISATLCLIGFLFPQSLLWLLGNKYQNLGVEVSWMIAGACVNYVGGVMWTMHSARKWIYWWGSFAYIGLLLVTQILCLIFMDLSTTLNVIYFSFITTTAVLLIHIAAGAYGFMYGEKTWRKKASATD